MRIPEANLCTGEEGTFQSQDSQASGIDGYIAAMKRYPALSREQTEAALEALRSGQRLDTLRSHTLFAPHLAQEEADLLNNPSVYHAPPLRSYRQLFADSPGIENLVAFGTFPTVHYWVKKFQTTYNGLPLAIEEFMQDALYKIVPEEVRRFDPAQGTSFISYISTMLRWRLDNLANACIRERSTLPAGVDKRGLRPKHDTRRLSIESLDAPLPEQTDNGDPGSFYDVVADERASLPGESLASGSAIRTLYAIAGISPKQAQVLQTAVIAGESQEYAASLCGVGVRAIRTRRSEAVKKFRRLGKERVIAILSGDADAPEKKK
jgi:DNA-directed RNA polymerase specialized sigma24 family protein